MTTQYNQTTTHQNVRINADSSRRGFDDRWTTIVGDMLPLAAPIVTAPRSWHEQTTRYYLHPWMTNQMLHRRCFSGESPTFRHRARGMIRSFQTVLPNLTVFLSVDLETNVVRFNENTLKTIWKFTSPKLLKYIWIYYKTGLKHNVTNRVSADYQPHSVIYSSIVERKWKIYVEGCWRIS